MRAILGVYDKTGIEAFARGLTDLGWELASTGGTYAAVHAAGIPVRKVEELTGFPEMLDGRVKTLHPAVHGGILARRDLPAHMAALKEHEIGPIDLVACNLYPFYATVTRPISPLPLGEGSPPSPLPLGEGRVRASFDEGIENIDIGGPTMLRAAAKNHRDVWVVCDPADYDEVLAALRVGQAPSPARTGEGARATPGPHPNPLPEGEGTMVIPTPLPEGEGIKLRRRLAWKAFQHVASYDSTVAEWLWDGEGRAPALTVPLELAQELRYGENPHQSGAFYLDKSLSEHGRGGIATAVQRHGKEMSYNNYLDADAAWNAVNDFPGPTCVIVKHTNPCGVATRDDLLEAYRLAVRADATSAFGGIVALNRPVDGALARELREFRSPHDGETRMFYEIVIAPAYTEEGLRTLQGKSKDLRILEAQPRKPGGRALRQVGGGWLVQGADDLRPEDIVLQVVTERRPTPQQLDDLKFAWRCVKHVKSNAITIARDGRLLGMGSGQPNRVKSVEIAMEKAGDEVRGAALASDAFFPFAWGDSIEKACQAGVAIIGHPGGSMRDQDGIDCCNQYGVAMVLTGTRHFRH